MTATAVPVDNGVNVEALLGVREALASTPQIAQVQWRSSRKSSLIDGAADDAAELTRHLAGHLDALAGCRVRSAS
jgi:hypothetical protein